MTLDYPLYNFARLAATVMSHADDSTETLFDTEMFPAGRDGDRNVVTL